MRGDKHLPTGVAGATDDSNAAVIGASPAMQRLHRLIDRVAATDATVLITGESGTGKEMIAGEFFRRSRRRDQPYVRVNCAAISPTLIESEFFGHEKGAYTGATERREGRFELAHEGTLLLDEVSEIPPALQAKLLRVLQEREFERVGGSRTIKVNVRVIATSNRDLLSHVASGQFRQDLYYRLNVFPIQIPPLRERVEDIPLLAEHFLKRFSARHGVAPAGFSAEARRVLLTHRWPGNVRELQNTIERAVILGEPGEPVSAEVLGLPDDVGFSGGGVAGARPVPAVSAAAYAVIDRAPSGAAEPAAGALWVGERPADRKGSEAEPVAGSRAGGVDRAPPQAGAESAAAGSIEPFAVTAPGGRPLTLGEIEKRVIREALERHRGNRTHAAVTLGISIRTLRNKLAEYRVAGEPLDDVGLEPQSTAA